MKKLPPPFEWSVWCVVTDPDYDNYNFDLFITREAAIQWIKASVGTETGEWVETDDGSQIEFHGHTPVRRIKTGIRIWHVSEVPVGGSLEAS